MFFLEAEMKRTKEMLELQKKNILARCKKEGLSEEETKKQLMFTEDCLKQFGEAVNQVKNSTTQDLLKSFEEIRKKK